MDYSMQDSFGFINRMEIFPPDFSTSKYYDLELIDKYLSNNLKDKTINGKLEALKYFAFIYHEFLQDAKGDKLTAGNCEFIISEIDIRVSELSKKLRAQHAKPNNKQKANSKKSDNIKRQTTLSRHGKYLDVFNDLTRNKKYSIEKAYKEICNEYGISEKTLIRAIKNI